MGAIDKGWQGTGTKLHGEPVPEGRRGEGEGRTRGLGWRRGLPGGRYGLQERDLSLAGAVGKKDVQRLCPVVLMTE